MLTRPSQMPGVVRFDPLMDWDDHCAYEAEQRAARWLDRIICGCIGLCAGSLALWLSLMA